MAEKTPEAGILRTDIYNIRFYEKSPFYGSYRGMNYRIQGGSPSGGAGDGDAGSDEERRLCVTVWPGPYNFETTDERVKVSAWFDFSNAGLDAVTEYLNAWYRDHFS